MYALLLLILATSHLYSSEQPAGQQEDTYIEVEYIAKPAGFQQNSTFSCADYELIMAASHGATSAVQSLLNEGANPNCHFQETHEDPLVTPLQIAQNKGHGEVVQILIAHGAQDFSLGK